MDPEAEIRDYLDALDVAAAPLDLERRAELGGAGSVEDGVSASEQASGSSRRALSVESRALLWLTIGAIVLPFVGPAIGLWVAAGSMRWSLTQKRTAVLIFLVLSTMPFVLLVPAALAGEFMWIIGSGGFSLPFVPLGGILAAAYLVASSSLVLTVSRKT